MRFKKIGTKKELFYNSISDSWENKINNFETKVRLNLVFKDLLTKRKLLRKKFLEVGSGMGYFSQEASKAGANITAVDIGDKLVAMTKKRVKRGKFLVASASNLPFKTNTFDIVLSTEVIEHVERQQKSLDEMLRVLKKGGILVITTPNKFYKPIFDFLSSIKVRPYHGNEKWISPDTLVTMLGKRVTIKKLTYFNFYINYALLCIKR